MTKDEFKREYEICKQRGHQSDGRCYTSNPPQSRCKWCGTFWRAETVVRETWRHV